MCAHIYRICLINICSIFLCWNCCKSISTKFKVSCSVHLLFPPSIWSVAISANSFHFSNCMNQTDYIHRKTSNSQSLTPICVFIHHGYMFLAVVVSALCPAMVSQSIHSPVDMLHILVQPFANNKTSAGFWILFEIRHRYHYTGLCYHHNKSFAINVTHTIKAAN